MKQFLFIAIGVLLCTACGESTKTSFFVQGNCLDCKPIIESKIQELPGIDSVGWDFESSMLTVKYFASEIAPDMLQQELAKAGFDTQFYPAEAEARKALPSCCQQEIDRKLKRDEPAFH